MKRYSLRPLIFSLILLLLVSCSFQSTPDPNLVIHQAVAQTLAAIPTSTQAPLATPYPSPTPFDLNGIFCEYQFCIGHPNGMAFYDHLASLNPQAPSQYNNGFIIAYQKIPTLVINVIWLQAPGTSDPKFLLDTIVDDQSDTISGNSDVKLVRNMNVIYTPITTIVSPDVPFGGAGAWTCGDRVFAWKAYVSTSDKAEPMFEEALARFSCGQ